MGERTTILATAAGALLAVGATFGAAGLVGDGLGLDLWPDLEGTPVAERELLAADPTRPGVNPLGPVPPGAVAVRSFAFATDASSLGGGLIAPATLPSGAPAVPPVPSSIGPGPLLRSGESAALGTRSVAGGGRPSALRAGRPPALPASRPASPPPAAAAAPETAAAPLPGPVAPPAEPIRVAATPVPSVRDVRRADRHAAETSDPTPIARTSDLESAVRKDKGGGSEAKAAKKAAPAPAAAPAASRAPAPAKKGRSGKGSRKAEAAPVAAPAPEPAAAPPSDDEREKTDKRGKRDNG